MVFLILSPQPEQHYLEYSETQGGNRLLLNDRSTSRLTANIVCRRKAYAQAAELLLSFVCVPYSAQALAVSSDPSRSTEPTVMGRQNPADAQEHAKQVLAGDADKALHESAQHAVCTFEIASHPRQEAAHTCLQLV